MKEILKNLKMQVVDRREKLQGEGKCIDPIS